MVLVVRVCNPLLLQYGYTALYIASRNGHERIVEALIDSGANVDLQITVRIIIRIHFPLIV